MSKKAKFKKNIDPFTTANEIRHELVDKKKDKRSPTEKNRHHRHQQKEIVKQLASDLTKLSENDIDILEDISKDSSPVQKNEVIYTIWPVKSKE